MPRLLRCLEDPDSDCRALTCGALGALGGAEMVSVLVGATRSGDTSTECAAIQALGRLGIPDSHIDVVKEALASNIQEVRTSAEYALGVGLTNAILEQLLKAKPKNIPATSLWNAIKALPVSCRPWFKKMPKFTHLAVIRG